MAANLAKGVLKCEGIVLTDALNELKYDDCRLYSAIISIKVLSMINHNAMLVSSGVLAVKIGMKTEASADGMMSPDIVETMKDVVAFG